ncbi:MAG: fused signal recognition particle receptor [Caballeronia mineralivorans]|jgi:fused signal recognition particle receptor|nr:fused signal recognition particle receptor [Caballeronia mineralivorans]
MFSFFKRLIGKSTDTPEENKTEDVADSGSEGAEALRHATTPVMPAQPVETLQEGGEAAVRTSETQACGADVGAGAPVQSNGHVSAAEPAATTGSSSAPVKSHDGSVQPVESADSVVQPSRANAPGVTAAETPASPPHAVTTPSTPAQPTAPATPAGNTQTGSAATSLHPATSPVTPVQPASPLASASDTQTGSTGSAASPLPAASTPIAPAQPTPPSANTAPEAKPYWQGRTASQWKAPEESVVIVPPPEPEPSAKRSWLTRLKTGLSKTSTGLTGIFIGATIDEDLYEELETALLMSDAGVEATEYLLEALREKVRSERLTDSMQVKAALRSLLAELLRPLEKSLMLGRAQPLVMMIAGVNGAGKTTSIGKLAKHLQRFDQSVLLAAGDTFRAAAREQLTVWGERNNVTVVSQESGDAAAVIFDAVGAARARKIDVMMADTAGRLPTQLHLMEELRKVKRVIAKAQPDAPHEVLLVIDANTGQNALAQVKSFDDALGLTGLIVTKLDGTAKGGILAAIARQRPIPVYFIGVGEKVEDLQPFSADEFADALLGN